MPIRNGSLFVLVAEEQQVKHIYFRVLIAGVFFVVIGILLLIVLVATGRASGDGFYLTTSEQRASIKGRDVGNRHNQLPDHFDDMTVVASNDRSESGVDRVPDDGIDHEGADKSGPVEVMTVSGMDKAQSISRPSETIDVTISGSGHTVTITSGTTVNLLSISGSSHFVTLEADTDVNRISVSGTENVIVVPKGIEYDITNSGISTQVVESDSNGNSTDE